jgi:hypothetical protein
MVIPNKSLSKEECLHNNKCTRFHRICEYYKIPIPVDKKFDFEHLVECVTTFEQDPNNAQVVQRRQLLWSYLVELQQDTYTSKFIYFDVYY